MSDEVRSWRWRFTGQEYQASERIGFWNDGAPRYDASWRTATPDELETIRSEWGADPDFEWQTLPTVDDDD